MKTFAIKRGATFEVQGDYSRDGVPLNLTAAGITCTSKVRNAADSELVETLAVTYQDQDATPGKHSLRSAGTDNWPASVVWDVRYSDGDNVLYTNKYAIRVDSTVS